MAKGHKEKKEIKKIGASLIFSWIFSIIFLLAGLGSFVSSWISGVFYILAGLIIFPPLTKELRDRHKFEFSTTLKIILVILFLILAVSLGGNIEENKSIENSVAQNVQGNTGNEVKLNNAIQSTNVYDYFNEKGEDLDFKYANATWFSEFLETFNEEEYCENSITPSAKYMAFGSGYFLLVNAETFNVECDYINYEEPSEDTSTPAVEEQSDKSTLGERNALKSAQSYLKYSGFSEKGLKDQLEYEGYTSSEIDYAIDNVVVDWNEEARESAESYLKYSSFSKQELHDQLEYEGFTGSQIQYALEQVGY